MEKLFTPNIMDVEASGFGSFSYPIEVGVVNSEGRKFCRLVKPQMDWLHWDKKAEALHGISRDLLLTNGVSIDVLCQELNEFLQYQIVYSDGWVVDQPWIIKLFDAANLNMAFQLSPLEMILKEPQMAVWHKTKERVSQNMQMPRHRASTDAALIQHTFIETQKLTMSSMA